ncbi:hypothetical protein NT6N_27050 [Oceaniferula spumae]|uniref:Uncharacterized protein n=1 Tax=Oceaniferula spumae TaxID=2979115 RepID=A0AAT9FNU0_9BACT
MIGERLLVEIVIAVSSERLLTSAKNDDIHGLNQDDRV